MGFFHNISDLIDLVLKDQKISRLEMFHGLIHLLSGDLLVGASVEQNAVLPVTVSLDNGMAGLSLHVGYQAHIHSRVLHHVQQKLPVAFSHSSGVPYLSSALCQGDGLV